MTVRYTVNGVSGEYQLHIRPHYLVADATAVDLRLNAGWAVSRGGARRPAIVERDLHHSGQRSTVIPRELFD